MSEELWIKGGELWILVGFFDALKKWIYPLGALRAPDSSLRSESRDRKISRLQKDF